MSDSIDPAGSAGINSLPPIVRYNGEEYAYEADVLLHGNHFTQPKWKDPIVVYRRDVKETPAGTRDDLMPSG